MRPKICVSVLPKNASELKQSIRHAESQSADLVEVRFDRLHTEIRRKDLEGRDRHRIPLIATNRNSPRRTTSGADNKPLDSLFTAVDAGFDYVDLDLETPGLSNVQEKFRRENA